MPPRWPFWNRREATPAGLVHLSDRGVQYLAIRYNERLAEGEAVSSVGSRGDSYDGALAETVNGLYNAELINRHGPWRSVADVELATASWVHFWNAQLLPSACGDIPSAEFEAATIPAQRPARPPEIQSAESLRETQDGSTMESCCSARRVTSK